jgi:hypothetical protein
MASKYWKSALLLVITFPLLLALQLGAVWIMINPEHRLELPTWDDGKTAAVNLASVPSVTVVAATTTSANTLSPTRWNSPSPNIHSAKAALAELTTQLPGLRPWIPDFAELQAQPR